MEENKNGVKERLHRRFYKEYKEKREHVLAGYVNCIPFPFARFRRELPGIEQKKNYIVTANSKVGKTQLADFLFVLSPLIYAYNNKDKIKLKILYFSLEMSVQEKMSQFTCFWLYMFSRGKIRIDTKQLNSLNEKSPLAEEVLNMLDSREYKDFFDFLEDTIIFDETNRNPYGIFKQSVDFALANGSLEYTNRPFKEKVEYIDPDTGEKVTKMITKMKRCISHYKPNNPNLYIIKIVDHVSLYTTEKGMNLRETMGKASSQDNVMLRNIYGFTNVDVQQQAADKEGNEAFKLDRITPTPDGLGDNKTTQRDCNIMLGLFSPWRHQKGNWHNYDITKFKDNIRFLEVCLNRNGASGAVCPLYFDGAVNFFAELPLPDDTLNLTKYEQMAYNAQL